MNILRQTCYQSVIHEVLNLTLPLLTSFDFILGIALAFAITFSPPITNEQQISSNQKNVVVMNAASLVKTLEHSLKSSL
jgi:hypothetical protein